MFVFFLQKVEKEERIIFPSSVFFFLIFYLVNLEFIINNTTYHYE